MEAGPRHDDPRVLIANRGEIAVRIIRTCRAMGIGTVAVYSEADGDAPHVAAADEAVAIGPPPARESYLNIAAIVDARASARRRRGASGLRLPVGERGVRGRVRRGRPDLHRSARRGHSRDGIEDGGARATRRRPACRSCRARLPTAQSDDAIAAAVRDGRLSGAAQGRRRRRRQGHARRPQRPTRSWTTIGAARREAERAFGNGTLYVERLIERPRHIEVQILGDTARHGRAPVRARLHAAAAPPEGHRGSAGADARARRARAPHRRRASPPARAVGYVNAGTVEFLVEGDGDDAQFYFLEMNTRLQVEHPVTEAITGLDLVRAQLLIAAGEPLPFTPGGSHDRGHAIECRVYAEDSRRLLPQSGTLLRYGEPAGDGIRVDSGVRAGQTMTVHYDPLLAKLIAHAATRDEAIARMTSALRQFEILGVHHNIRFPADAARAAGVSRARRAHALHRGASRRADRRRDDPRARRGGGDRGGRRLAATRRARRWTPTTSRAAAFDPWLTPGPARLVRHVPTRLQLSDGETTWTVET